MLRFVSSQLALESVPLRLAEGKRMNDFSDYYNNAWDNGFNVIEDCNNLINYINNSQSEGKFDKQLTELRTIKAFTYYNIAQLWHNIPLFRNEDDMHTKYSQSDIDHALDYVIDELRSCIESADEENPLLFNNDFRYMLFCVMSMII